jgi:hypothetical protein
MTLRALPIIVLCGLVAAGCEYDLDRDAFDVADARDGEADTGDVPSETEDARPDGDVVDVPPDQPEGWVVFRTARDLSALPMGDNLLANPALEEGDATTFTGWTAYEDGPAVETTTTHSAPRSVRLDVAAGEARGLYQSVTLDQTVARPLYVAGWCRAQDVTGEEDNDFSIYLDLRYTDDTPLYGQTIRCPVGTHDWSFGERVIVPDKPLRSLSFYLLLRNGHAGTAWFDDLVLREIETDVASFDDELVYTEPPAAWPFEGSAPVAVAPAAGPTLTLSSHGGAVVGLSTAAGALEEPDAAFAGGFFARDVLDDGDFLHFGGTVEATADGATHTAVDADLGLQLDAAFLDRTDRLEVDVTLRDLLGVERAVTLYFTLPVAFDGWQWGDDARTARTIEGGAERRNTIDVGWGAHGRTSRYPWASVAGTDGLALGYPLDHPAQLRLVANPHTHQLYAAMDVALTAASAEPRTARWRLVLYRFDPAWGFRAAARRYIELYPALFEKRVDREGLWVAFSDLSPLPGIEDFGIAFHELGGRDQIAYDDTVDVLAFRYLTEPWSYWMTMPTELPNDDETAVLAYLNDQLAAPEEWHRQYAEATLSSCTTDETGRFRFEPAAEPWCPYGAVFTNNPDPDIADPEHPLNKGNLAWNDDARAIYSDPSVGLQDGEYLDSLEAKAELLDYRPTHLAAADFPLVFDAAFRPAVPEIFATYEFARWVADEIHGMGKLMMANGALLRFAFPAHLFDVMGNERDWMYSGSFTPQRDDLFLFWRTLSYRKPFCTLMNTDFSAFGRDYVERYLRISLFYGVYPSMFSHNASEDRYWDDPALFERDRDLFVRYVPLIRELGETGWEPVTGARSSDPEVLVERWGSGDELRFTVRSIAAEERTATIAIEPATVGLTAGAAATFTEQLDGGSLTAAPAGGNLELSLTLAPEAVRLLRVVP